MTVAALEITGLKKRFGGVVATRDVSLTVMPGERRLLIGPNGAGKTTLFNLITGDLRADTGSIRLFGKELRGLSTRQRVRNGLARTYQILTLFAQETLLHNVAMALIGTGSIGWLPWGAFDARRDLRDASQAALERVGLGPFAHRIVAETSYGERRRLELAMALAQSPKVLLLDEPLAGLSAQERDNRRRRARRLAARRLHRADRARHGRRPRLRRTHHPAQLRRSDPRRHPRRSGRRPPHAGGLSR